MDGYSEGNTVAFSLNCKRAGRTLCCQPIAYVELESNLSLRAELSGKKIVEFYINPYIIDGKMYNNYKVICPCSLYSVHVP